MLTLTGEGQVLSDDLAFLVTDGGTTTLTEGTETVAVEFSLEALFLILLFLLYLLLALFLFGNLLLEDGL